MARYSSKRHGDCIVCGQPTKYTEPIGSKDVLLCKGQHSKEAIASAMKRK